jgi:membrane associated rhomboid family serine protease
MKMSRIGRTCAGTPANGSNHAPPPPVIVVAPYQVNTLFQRNPWGNLAIILVTVVVSILAWTETLSDDVLEAMVLHRTNPLGIVGHLLLHADIMHLIGNMLFLFVFGNAVCGVMNGFLYVGVYLALGMAAGGLHLLCDGAPAIGASGAVSGIMGLYLAIYPSNHISCFWLFFVRVGTFAIPGWVLIGIWFCLDLWGALHGGSGVAYWAHIGGTVAGFIVGIILLKLGVIDIYDYDNPTILQLVAGREG